MTSEEKLRHATRFDFPIRRFDAVKVELRDSGHGPHSGDGKPRWAVVFDSLCLATNGEEWDWEPMPSSRTDEWLARFRFTDLDAALALAQAWAARFKAGETL